MFLSTLGLGEWSVRDWVMSRVDGMHSTTMKRQVPATSRQSEDLELLESVRKFLKDLLKLPSQQFWRVLGASVPANCWGVQSVQKQREWWCDVGDRWWMRLTEWGRKIIPKTGWCISERAICDFERGRWWWTSDGNEWWRTSATRRLKRSGYGDMQVEQHRERALCERERESYIRYVHWLFSQWRDLRVGVIWENLGALTTAWARERETWIAVSWGDYNIVSCSNRVGSER